MVAPSPLNDVQLYDAWKRLRLLHDDLSEHAASDLLGCAHETLARAIAVHGPRDGARTEPWLVAQCLRLQADELELDYLHEAAGRMRATAAATDQHAMEGIPA